MHYPHNAPCSTRATWRSTGRYRLRVSPRLRTGFGNGEEFYSHAGDEVRLPEHRAARPNREFLEWHNDEVYIAS